MTGCVLTRNGRGERLTGTRDYDYQSDSNRLARVLTSFSGSRRGEVRPGYDQFGRLCEAETYGDVVNGLPGYGSKGVNKAYQYNARNEVSFAATYHITSEGTYPSDPSQTTFDTSSRVQKNSSEEGFRLYLYDPIGNRTQEKEHATSPGGDYATLRNSINQYDTYGGDSFVYDDNGNLLDDGERTYTYNAENRLVDVLPKSPSAGDLKLQNQYDYMGRRCHKLAWEWNGSSYVQREALGSRFVYDGWNLVAELSDESQQSHPVKKKYTWGDDVSGTAQGAGGVGGLLMVEIREGSSWKRLYPIYDHVHSVIGLQDDGGAVVARYDYDPFGQTFKASGSASSHNGDSNYAEANPFRYSTKYTDSYSTDFPSKVGGLVDYGLRHYVPDTGRFLNRDPIEEAGGLNLYAFVNNNPANHWDYLGMMETAPDDYVNGWRKGVDKVENRAQDELSDYYAFNSSSLRLEAFMNGNMDYNPWKEWSADSSALSASFDELRDTEMISEFYAFKRQNKQVSGEGGGAFSSHTVNGAARRGQIGGFGLGAVARGVGRFIKGTVGLVIGENWGAAWRSMFTEKWARGPTGGRLPESMANGLRTVGGSVPSSAAANGMHAWHSGSNAYLAKKLGILGAPLIFAGGVFHESPLDWGSFKAEQHFQGTVNHVLDSVTDIVANVFGMAVGYAIPGDAGVDRAVQWGNYIPGPGEPDPAFGGGGPYKGNPVDAWGQYP